MHFDIKTFRRMSRRLAERWNATLTMTAQERANSYVARMPIAVVAD